MRNFIKSFKYAFCGIAKAFSAGRNFKIMTVCFLLVIVLGFLFKVSTIEWIILLLCSGLVLSLEMLNTAIEKSYRYLGTCHLTTITLRKNAKDIAAGAVLVFSVTAAAAALIIFLPHIIEMFRFIRIINDVLVLSSKPFFKIRMALYSSYCAVSPRQGHKGLFSCL